MGKLIKLLIGATILVGLLLGIVVVTAFMVFDPNDHKQRIITKVEEETGRTLNLDGDIKLSYYPWLGLEVNSVTLGNAEGFGDKPFLHADAVALRIKTMPLLKKQYELDTLRLHGVEVNLAKNEAGVTNWDDLVSGKDDDASKQDSRQLAAVILGGVDIKDTRFTWSDESTGQQVTVSEMNMSTGELTFGEPIDIKMNLKAESNQPAIKTDMQMQGTASYDLDAETYAFAPIDLSAKLTGKNIPGGAADLKFNTGIEFNLKEDTAALNKLTLSLLGTVIQAQLNASQVKSGKPVTEGKLEVTGDDLATLFKVADIEPLATQLAKLKDRSFKVKTNLRADAGEGNVSVSDLDVQLIGATVAGNLDATNIESEKPALKGMLKASGPDLPTLLQVIGQFEGGEQPKLADYGKQLASAPNKAFAINTEFDANMASGNVTVPALSIDTLGIAVDGKLMAKDINSNNGNVDGHLSMKGEKLAHVLKAVGQDDLSKTLNSISIDVGLKGNQKDIKLSPLQAEAVFAGKQIPKSPATVKLSADSNINLQDQALIINNMAVAGLGLNIKGDIKAQQFLSEKPKAAGNVNLSGKDLALLLKVLGNDALASQVGKIKNKSFKVETGFNADMSTGNLDVSSLNATMLGANIKGNLAASNVQSETPAVKGELSGAGPDLPTLMQVLGQFQGGKQSSLSQYGKRLAKAPNKAFDISAKFNADMAKGNIDLPSLSAKGLGLTVNGKMLAKGLQGNQGNLDGQLSLRGEKLTALLAAFDQGALGAILKKVNMDIGVKGNRSDISLSPFNLKATLDSKDISNSPVDLTLAANTKVNLDKQTLSVSNMNLKGLGLNLTSNLSATKIIDDPSFTGDLALAEFNLRKFMKQMKQTVPATADKNVLKKVALQSKFSGTTNSLSLKDLSFLLDDSKLNGSFSIKHFTQPSIKFNLAVDSINADRYFPPQAQSVEKNQQQAKTKKGATKVKAEPAPEVASDIPLETLRKLNSKGEMQIGKLVYSNLKLKNIKLGVNAKDGLIELNPISADLYQGKYDGTITLDARGKSAIVTQETNLAAVQIEPLIKDHQKTPESQLAGVANITAKVSAKGTNAVQLKNSLGGKAKLNVTQGVLRGIDVRKTLEQAEVMLESKKLGTVKQGGETRFDQLGATLNIKNGVVKNNDLLMSAPGFQVNGGVDKRDTLGNLRNNSIKYDLSVAVVEEKTQRGEKNYNIGGYAIPIRCRGSLNDIASACKPDYGKLLGVAIQKGALEKLGDVIGIDLPGKKKSSSESNTKETTTDTSKQNTKQQQKSQPKNPVEDLKEEVLKGVLDKLF